jgi:prepilin-type N-terminal cleavage/methylation domain-containing protein
MRTAAGFSLLELVIALVIVGMACLIVVPSLFSASAALQVDLAARELIGALREARGLALRHSANVAIRFYPQPGRVGFAHFRDGDGDGVRNADIRRGVDPQITPLRYFRHIGGRVGFGFPPGRMPRDPGEPSRRLARREDPIRFNASELASFGPMGTATAGSLYLTDGRRHLVAVRLSGLVGRVRLLRWNPGADAWR